MSYPIKAFTRSIVAEVTPGSIVLVEGNWYFRGSLDSRTGPQSSVVALTGHNEGSIFRAPNSYGLALDEDYAWELRIPDPVEVVVDDRPRAGAALINTQGNLEIWGHIQGAPEYLHGFSLDGSHIDPAGNFEERPYYQFLEYEVWLLDPTGQPLGGEPLFSREIANAPGVTTTAK